MLYLRYKKFYRSWGYFKLHRNLGLVDWLGINADDGLSQKAELFAHHCPRPNFGCWLCLNPASKCCKIHYLILTWTFYFLGCASTKNWYNKAKKYSKQTPLKRGFWKIVFLFFTLLCTLLKLFGKTHTNSNNLQFGFPKLGKVCLAAARNFYLLCWQKSIGSVSPRVTTSYITDAGKTSKIETDKVNR